MDHPIVRADVNETITSMCSADGGPDNHFSWYLITTERVFLQNGSHLVVQVGVVNTTIYQCRVENSAGYGDENITVYGELKCIK